MTLTGDTLAHGAGQRIMGKADGLADRAGRTTTFLNVDLDISSRSDLAPLVVALGRKVIPLYVGREGRGYSAHLELARVPKDANTAIQRFTTLVRALPADARALWQTAATRDFNVGIQAALHPHAYTHALAPDTLSAAASLNARVVFTVYAAEGRDASEAMRPVAQRSARPWRRRRGVGPR